MFSFANILEIAGRCSRSAGGGKRTGDMTDLSDLARFVWAGGLAGPLFSALLSAPLMGE